jgi:signal transduction histidine kinase
MERLRRIGGRRDELLAGALLAVGLAEIWGRTLVAPGYPGSRAVQTLALAMLGVAVAARRRRPLAMLALTAVATTLQWAYARGHGQLPFETFLVVLLMPFTVGAHAPRLRGGLAVGGVAALWVAQDVYDASAGVASVRTDGGFYALVGLAWLAGCVVGVLGERTAELERLGAELRAEREERARAAVLEERTRIARELHDIVAHTISLMMVQVGGARQIMGAEPDTARDSLLAAETTGREALAELRRMLGVLRGAEDPAQHAPQPGLGDVGALAAQMREAGLDVTVDVEGPARRLPSGIDLTAYRLVQEALTNTLKHAGPVTAHVRIRYGDDALELEVQDRGPAGGERANGGGHGLVGMRERVALYGGAMRAGAQPGGGYAVSVHLPLEGT